MGRAKNEQMKHEEKVNQAIGLCMEVGTIEECPNHPGTYMDSMEYFDYDELAKKIVDEVPDALSGFKDRQDLAECVQEAMSQAGEECGSCAKYRDS